MQTEPVLVLASASPRRRALLEGIGARFAVEEAGCDESAADMLPARARVEELARMKCAAVAARHPDRVVIGADTMVLDAQGELLGKPKDEPDAKRMLLALSGRMNTVLTGVCVMADGGKVERRGVEETQVYFRELDEREIDRYIATGEPLDKAGAYGVQGRGALFVRRIEGDYFNVVGLPLVLTARLLGEVGYTL